MQDLRERENPRQKGEVMTTEPVPPRIVLVKYDPAEPHLSIDPADGGPPFNWYGPAAIFIHDAIEQARHSPTRCADLTEADLAAVKHARSRIAACKIAMPSGPASQAAMIREIEAALDVCDRLTALKPEPQGWE